MDFFEVFPNLNTHTAPALQSRALRLISVGGIVYDAQAFYFELSDERYWVRPGEDKALIGLDVAKLRLDDVVNTPVNQLRRHLHKTWRCDVSVFLTGYAHILDEQKALTVLTGTDSTTPYFLIFTPPRLGGGDEVPDALVQAIYLMPLHGWQKKSRRRVNLLQIGRDALGEFLERDDWELNHLLVQPWAKLHQANTLPAHTRIRPVLALRGLQHLWNAGVLGRDLAG
ncbi:MAG: hypothetical protein JXA33_14415 [Anaerolineae bacterium]|nr:hypothetical protein [Anaerolineae bacterium]